MPQGQDTGQVRGQEINCRVYFEDTDAGGVVYYANYLKFYERGRTEFLRNLGFEQDQLLEQNIVFVVRNVQVDFIRPARFNQMLRVTTAIKSMRKVGLVFEQSISTVPDDRPQLINNAEIQVACLSADRFRPVAIPRNILEKLKHNE
jgi:acyl-CoA thioester hydrolase